MKFSFLRKSAFGIFVAAIVIGFSGVSTDTKAEGAQEIEIKISTGAITQSASAVVDNGYFQVGYSEQENIVIKRSLLKIDLSDVPDNIKVKNAELNLRLAACSGDTTPIHIGRVISGWETGIIEWDNKPGFSTPIATSNLDCINALAFWDITDLIKGWVNGDYPNLGLIIYGPDERGSSSYERAFDVSDDNSLILITYEEIQPSAAKVFRENYLNKENVFLTLSLVMIFCLLILLYYQIKTYIKERKNEPRIANIIKKQEKKLVQSGEYLLKALVQKKKLAKEEENKENEKNQNEKNNKENSKK